MIRVSRRRHRGIDVWPGFVDAMATLLMVVIFVLMTFVLAQFYLTDSLSHKDQNLLALTQQVTSLSEDLENSKSAKLTVEGQLEKLKETLRVLEGQLSQTQDEKIAFESTASNLTQKIEGLHQEIKRLTAVLANEELEKKEQEEKFSNLSDQLNQALLNKTEELEAVNQKLLALRETNEFLNQEYRSVQEENKKFKGGMIAYRSEFFALLRKAVGERSDIRVVGDRFVFQSEVLFNIGSAELGIEGKKQLDALVTALKEITVKIPPSINWILRVDGHTDQFPINTTLFPSNWELSSARAISVVRYLISRGIPEKNLVAAGFGEYQPLEEEKSRKAQSRNRRIEFKLDQR